VVIDLLLTNDVGIFAVFAIFSWHHSQETLTASRDWQLMELISLYVIFLPLRANRSTHYTGAQLSSSTASMSVYWQVVLFSCHLGPWERSSTPDVDILAQRDWSWVRLLRRRRFICTGWVLICRKFVMCKNVNLSARFVIVVCPDFRWLCVSWLWVATAVLKVACKMMLFSIINCDNWRQIRIKSATIMMWVLRYEQWYFILLF